MSTSEGLTGSNAPTQGQTLQGGGLNTPTAGAASIPTISPGSIPTVSSNPLAIGQSMGLTGSSLPGGLSTPGEQGLGSSSMGLTGGNAPAQGQTMQSINTPQPGNFGIAPLPMNPTTNPGGPEQPISSSGPPVTQTITSSGASPTSNPGVAGLTFDQVENYWIQAGGSPQAAAMAAAVADAESGLNPQAQRTNPDGTTGIGLWLTPSNGTPPGSTDPLASARGAIQLSNNGTDWTQWCSTWSDNNCGQNNGTYLGSGANALMSLGTQASSPSYGQIGSVPAGSGVGASSATSGSGGSTTPSSSKNLMLFGIIIAVVLVIFWISRRRGQAQPQEQPAPKAPEQ